MSFRINSFNTAAKSGADFTSSGNHQGIAYIADHLRDWAAWISGARYPICARKKRNGPLISAAVTNNVTNTGHTMTLFV